MSSPSRFGPDGGSADTDLSGFRHGRVPRLVRERQLLALAEVLFAERGFSAASMDELARRAGISKPVIYALVGSKDNVFRACMDRVAEGMAARVVEAVRTEIDPRRRLLAGAQAWFDFIADHRALWTALLAGGDTPLGAEAAEIRRRQARVIAGLLADDADDTDVEASSVLIDAIAHLIVGAFESIGRWSAEHPELGPAALGELCTAVLFPGLMALNEAPPVGWESGTGT
ncbi:MAG: TetR/AcrR family transcriptional regulator [Actinomycetota bacterium]|nr:TetR/AcrR family transcriptional regulator [Actinomycetota bacterium]